MKGGVGKTTLSVNLAYALAYLHAKKVLLIDLDPQFNATQYLMPVEEYEKWIENEKGTIINVFIPKNRPSLVQSGTRGERYLIPELDDLVYTVFTDADRGKLDLIPSELKLMNLNYYSAPGIENRLANFIATKCAGYDYVFIDCPPTISIFTASAFKASDSFIIPMKPDHLSSLGTPLLLSALEDYEENYNIKPELAGIIFTIVEKTTTLNKERMKKVRGDFGDLVFENYLSKSTNVARAVNSNEPLFKYRKAKKQGEEIEKITEEFLYRSK